MTNATSTEKAELFLREKGKANNIYNTGKTMSCLINVQNVRPRRRPWPRGEAGTRGTLS